MGRQKKNSAYEMAKKIQMVDVDALTPYIKNARTHSDEQIDQIAASITEFGFTNPILTDKVSGVIAGHGRLMAAKRLGLEKVPTICLDHLDENQKRAYIIADNKIAENAGWDMETLAKEVQELHDEEFDLDLLGFNEEELTKMLEGSIAEEDSGITPKQREQFNISIKGPQSEIDEVMNVMKTLSYNPNLEIAIKQ